MPKPDSLQGALDLLVLKILMTAIKDRSQDVLRNRGSTLYPALLRMEETGWIRQMDREGIRAKGSNL